MANIILYGVDEIEKDFPAHSEGINTTIDKFTYTFEGGLLNLNYKRCFLTKIQVLHNTYVKTYFLINNDRLVATVLSPCLEFSLVNYYLFGIYKYKLNLPLNEGVFSVGKLSWPTAALANLMPSLQEKKVIYIDFQKHDLRFYVPYSDNFIVFLKENKMMNDI